MCNLVVHIISKEMIKPSSSTTNNLKPFKITYFDQLTPTTYVPTIYFYSNIQHATDQTNISTTLTQLKLSLSKTLDIYYPLSGRVRNNTMIDSFHEGVPFFVSQVKSKMVEFLKHRDIDSLSKFLPCKPFVKEIDMEVPCVSIQVNVFNCGGIAIGMSFQHKVGDVTTFTCFTKTWAAISLGCKDKIIFPNFAKASTSFPPQDSLPKNNEMLMNTLWFSQKNLVTKRFMFSTKSISALKSKAKGQSESFPSRVESLSGFIWKCYMRGSRGSTNASLLVQAVNIRPRSTQYSLDGEIGNLFWWAPALANSTETENELNELLVKMKEGVNLFDEEYLTSLQGDEGYLSLSCTLDQLEEIISCEKPDILGFTSWCNLGLNEINFGLGKPVWIGVMGKPGPEFRNLVVFIDWKNGIEAWITLNEERMAILEQDVEFLAFATPNPTISRL